MRDGAARSGSLRLAPARSGSLRLAPPWSERGRVGAGFEVLVMWALLGWRSELGLCALTQPGLRVLCPWNNAAEGRDHSSRHGPNRKPVNYSADARLHGALPWHAP